jgi:hypothetical protein
MKIPCVLIVYKYNFITVRERTITIVFRGIIAKTGTEECHERVIEYVIAMNFERKNAPE